MKISIFHLIYINILIFLIKDNYVEVNEDEESEDD